MDADLERVAEGGTFAYDALDRLVADVTVAKYAYDVLGRRIAKRVYSGPDAGYVRYLYRGGEVAAEADSGGTLKRAYTWGMGADNLVAIHDYVGGHDYYVGQDQLSSTRWVVRSDGTWQMTLRYASYGVLLDSTGTLPFPLRYRWIGREYDEETGLYYLRARYYAPSIARFIQEDPGGHATTSNPYAYGEGNPTNGRDLNGLMEGALAYMTPPPTLELEIQQDLDAFLLGGGDLWGGNGLAWAHAEIQQEAAAADTGGAKNDSSSTPTGPVVFVGPSGCGENAVGGCVSTGLYLSRQGFGSFTTVFTGWGVGDGSGVTAGISTADALQGLSVSGTVGGVAGGATVAGNPRGLTLSVEIGPTTPESMLGVSNTWLGPASWPELALPNSNPLTWIAGLAP